MPSLRSILLFIGAVVATLSLVSACETAPPVQEMSDARQAIAVAREAGPADDAAKELESAESYLESAEKNLDQRQYSEARDDALEAKARAIKSLKLTESEKTPYN